MRLRTKMKKVVVAVSFATLAISVGFLLYFNFSGSKDAYAAVSNDYRSITSGSWNSTSTWQRYNGSSWVAATSAPTSSHKTITIQSGHTVNVTANVTVDQVVIAAGGTVNINSGVTYTIANGTGTDLSVAGTLRNAGTVTLSSSSISYSSGGTYQHNYTTTAGVIPAASWSNGSTCEIIGYTTNTSAPTGMQSFKNFTWNCPSQTSTINLNGTLTTVNGDLSIVSTGSGELRISNNSSTINIGNDLLISGGNFGFSVAASQTSTVNISGNFNMSGGNFSAVNGNNSTANLNLSGDYIHSDGIITHGGNSATSVRFNFSKSGTQLFNSSSTSVLQNVDYVVNSGSILSMGENICYGRNFTLSSGAGIETASADGISASGSIGNVQSSGTRTFNSGADYTYNGTFAQVSGSGLPGTVRHLRINNSSGLSLDNSTIVTGVLTLSEGRISTGANTLHVSNTSTSAITGNSNTSYVIGNLRRSVLPTGNYSFPLGTNEYYELISSNLVLAVGFTSILATFVQTDPLLPAFPLNSIKSNNVEIDSMLNYGYWTLTPNSPITAGVHTVTLSEQGYSNSVGSKTLFFALSRPSTSSSWGLTGANIAVATPLSGGVATASTGGLLSFNHYAIGYGSILAFTNPTLISGSDGQVGAIYKFPNVCSEVDAWMEIVELAGGATLSSIDESSTGYNEAFQPFINIPGHSTASIQWRIRFKVAGTSTDTTLAKVQLTGVDVDGGGGIREFIEATYPTSYSLNSPTILTVTNSSGNYRAVSNFSTVSNIDTSARQAMYQMNYNNVNSFLYRTGAISTNSGSETRQTSLYFASFLTGNIALPISLTRFEAELREDRVFLVWTTASEIDNDYFTIERSSDGETFEELKRKRGAGNSTSVLNYSLYDESPLKGYSYYRLKQTDYDGKYSYSNIVKVKNGKLVMNSDLDIYSISPNPFSERFTVRYTIQQDSEVDFMLVNSAGKILASQRLYATKGFNDFDHEINGRLETGIYFVVLSNQEQKIVKKILKQ